MHANKAHPFLSAGYPLVTIKYPPHPVTLRGPLWTPKSCCPHDLTSTPKTVSFMVQLHTPSEEKYGSSKSLDLIRHLLHRRLCLWTLLL